MRYALAPATCGQAMLVPESVAKEVLEPIHADVMSVPGARMSTKGPKSEYQAWDPFEFSAPTVIMSGRSEGDCALVSIASLPDDANAAIPTSIAAWAAASTACDEGVTPKDMLMRDFADVPAACVVLTT